MPDQPTDAEILDAIRVRLACDYEDILKEFKKLMEEDNGYRNHIDKLERLLSMYQPTHLSFPTEAEIEKIGFSKWAHWKDGV